MFASALKATKYGGAITCCGLVNSSDLSVNVFPFIIRGVRLIGIDSVKSSTEWRSATWHKLTREWSISLDQLTTEVGLHEIEDRIVAILAGKQKGRVLVDINKT